MNLLKKIYEILFLSINFINFSNAFIPSKNLNLLTELLDNKLESNEHLINVGETLTHAEISRQGLIRSVVAYFLQKQSSTNFTIGNYNRRVRLDKLNVYYTNLNELYKDYLGDIEFKLISCNLEFDSAIKTISDFVISVDFDPVFKDLPYAHFDAETFEHSNEHILKLITSTLTSINRKDFPSARKFIGQALHTIQDFYSHTNWIEMGYEDINEKIGSFSSLNKNGIHFGVEIADERFNSCSNQSCIKEVIECSSDLKGLEKLSKAFNLNLPITCPIIYYKCFNNVLLSKLTSGFYSGQKLSDGSKIEKPKNISKCSHGGYLDKTATYSNVVGGINKDTSYYFLSPHAHLHKKASELAIKHTEHFFNFIHSQIGDENFDELLMLMHGQSSRFYCLFKKIFL